MPILPYITIAKIGAIVLLIVFTMILYRGNQSLKHDLSIANERLASCSHDLKATTTTLQSTIADHNAKITELQTKARETAEANRKASDLLTAQARRLEALRDTRPTIPRNTAPMARIDATEAALEAHRALVKP